LTTHIEDNVRHITSEEREKWNAKADKKAFDELELDIKAKLNNISGIDTSNFATRADIEGLRGDWASKTDLSLLRTELMSLINSANGTHIDTSSFALKSELNGYIKNGALLGTINGQNFYHGGSVTINTGNTGGSVDLTGYATQSWVN
jgi:hypothetical protein